MFHSQNHGFGIIYNTGLNKSLPKPMGARKKRQKKVTDTRSRGSGAPQTTIFGVHGLWGMSELSPYRIYKILIFTDLVINNIFSPTKMQASPGQVQASLTSICK